MASVTINAPSGGFLYTNSKNARLIITAETPEFDGEFVEGHVLIQRMDDPITPGPDGTSSVLFVAVGICITRQIQPRTRPAFAVTGGFQ